MAQAQYDKFVELRQQGVDALTARKQAYGDIPVAPTAPTLTGGATLPIAPQVAETPTTPVTTTPVAPVTPTPLQPIDPIQPSPIEKTSIAPTITTPANNIIPEVKPVAITKQEPIVDYTQAKGREAEITANLDSFKAKGMTPDEIMRASDYQNASPEKKALIEPYLKQQVPTASAMYNAIASKADIPEEQKASLPYKIANNRYMKANMYSTMTPSQLSSEMTNSKLIQGSQAYEDLKAMNPKLVQDTENLRIVNGSKQNVWTYTNTPDGTPVKVNNLEKTFADDFDDNFGEVIKQMYAVQTPEQIRAIINTPDAVAAQEKATQIELSMNELEKQMENIDSDVDKELAGTGATGSRLALEKASRRSALEKEYNSQLKNYTTYANKANNIITQNTTLYTTQQQQKQAQNAAMLPFLQDQYKTAQAKKQAEFELNDPATQIKATLEEFSKFGVTATGGIPGKVQEAKDWIAKGGTLDGYINQMRKDLMAKPEYKKIQELQQGQMSDAQKMSASQNFDMKKIGLEQDFQMALAKAKNVTNNKWTKLDDGLYTNEDGEIMTSDELKTAKLVGNTYLQKQVGEEGGDCGFYASRGTGMSSTPGGNSKEARTKAFSETTPQVGGMAFFGGTGYDPTYGHISIVTGVNADGTINIKDSNYNNDGKVTERTVPASTATGFYNNTPLAQSVNGQGATTGGFTDSDIAVLGSVAKLDKQGKQTLNENGLTERDWANFNAGLLPPTAKQKQESQVVVDRVDDILKGDWTDAVGPFLGKSRIFTGGGTDRKVTELKVQALKDLLAMANLDKIKGAMSDKDIEFLRNTATYLSTDLSESEFEKTLNEIKTKYANIAGGNPTTGTAQVSSTNTGVGQLSSEASSIEQEWLKRNK